MSSPNKEKDLNTTNSKLKENDSGIDHRLTRRILIAMASAIILGCLFYEAMNRYEAGQILFFQWINDYLLGFGLELIGQYFVRALKLVVVPLVFFSLVSGITQSQINKNQSSQDQTSSPNVLKIASFTFILYLLTTMIAISLALTFASFIQPGSGVQQAANVQFQAPPQVPIIEVFKEFMPVNIFEAFSSGNMLAVIVVSILFGIAMNKSGSHGVRMASICQDANEVVIRLIILIMNFAPIGVFALVFEVFAQQGVYFMAQLSSYFLTVTITLLLHGTLVYGSLLVIMAKVNPVHFLKKMRQVIVFAFSTASSAATIGINLKNSEEKLGVKNEVASLTIPLGATINMDGTAIMQGVATVFIAGVYGIDLTIYQLIQVILMATMASVGTAAVPSAGLVTLSMVLVQVNLPVEAIGLIIGVDRLLDMMRTALNVTGDAAITMVVAEKEQGIDRSVLNEPSR